MAVFCVPLRPFSQPKTVDREQSGIYENTWRYKNDRELNKSYVRVAFVNDSIFTYTVNDNKMKLGFNTTSFSCNCIGRRVLYKGQKRRFIIRDDGNIGYEYAFSMADFTSNKDRMDFVEAVNTDWDHSRFKSLPSKNP